MVDTSTEDPTQPSTRFAPTPRWSVGPVAASPYAWPYDGSVDAARAALICIDWQVDFCGPGGYVDRMGYDIGADPRRACPATAAMLAHARATGMLVIHTREGHAPDLSDLPANKRWRSAQIGAEIGVGGPVRADPGPRRAGLGDRAGGRADRRARWSSTSRARAPSTPPTSTWCCARTAITHIDPDRHHHRRLRAHDHARGERPRLRVPDPVRLHRRHRPGQPRRRPAHGDHAGRGLRLRVATSDGRHRAATDREDAPMQADAPCRRAEPYPFTLRPGHHRAGDHRHAARLRRARRLRRDARQRRVSLLQPVVAAAAARCWPPPARSGLTVIHTREGHVPDLSDCPPAKLDRGDPSLRIGDPGPKGRILIRGEYGHDIIDDLAPAARRAGDRQAGQGLVPRHRRSATMLAGARHHQRWWSPASPPRCACTPPSGRPTTAATSASCCPTASAPTSPSSSASAWP